MVLDEEDVMNKKASCILDFNDNLQPNSVSPVHKVLLGVSVHLRKMLLVD